YASPSNMLLANSDYALETVSIRLVSFSSYAHFAPVQSSVPTVPSLSIQVLQVLRALICLIGRAIINRAYDVLNECFDRLNDYHGYVVVVQALDEREDVGAVEEKGEERWQEFVKWFKERNKKPEKWEIDPTDSDQDPDLEAPSNQQFLALVAKVLLERRGISNVGG
ncbi:hypothetical protein FRC07_005373, partial [Ceratobasidium sp. 392]